MGQAGRQLPRCAEAHQGNSGSYSRETQNKVLGLANCKARGRSRKDTARFAHVWPCRNKRPGSARTSARGKKTATRAQSIVGKTDLIEFISDQLRAIARNPKQWLKWVNGQITN